MAGIGCLIQKSSPELVPRLLRNAFCLAKVGAVAPIDEVAVLRDVGEGTGGAVNSGLDVGVPSLEVETPLACEAESFVENDEGVAVEVSRLVELRADSDEDRSWCCASKER